MPGLSLLAVMLALAPFSGPSHRDGPATRTAFTVAVRGDAGEIVRLRAVGVPPGYIASFCTRSVCAPFAVTLTLPRSGRDAIELDLIENISGSVAPQHVRVEARGAAPASISFARGTRVR